ncbi:MAG: sialate O-acetylesterase, partial [Chitinophagaceae bacterium]
MKRFLFLFSAILALHANGQTPKWDSTHRPGNFALKVDLFRSYPNSAKDIIFLGNSITAGV